MTELLAGNLAALRTGHPSLARAVELAAEPSGAEAIPTRDGDWTARIPLAGGAAATLHSRFDPRGEALRFVGDADPGAVQGFLVLGFGLGYHLQALAGRANHESRIVVLERDPGLLRLAASRRDLRGLFADRRISWLVGLDRQGLYQGLRSLQVVLMSSQLIILPHAPSTALAPDYYQEARQAIRDFAISGQMAMVSQFMLGRKTLVNQLRNLPLYVGAPSLAELRPLFAGRPGIVVSAGPSLRRNIDGLRAARGRAVLVACDIVLKPLLERGIVPDFTAIVDFQGQTRKFFETLPERVPTRLVAIGPAFHDTVRFYPGPLAFAGDPLMDQFLEEARRDMGGFFGGGNVGHFCFLIACHLGLSPIAFVGQDLSFPLNIGHLPGTPKHEEWQNERNRFYTLEMRELEVLLRRRESMLKVPSQDGGEVFTERSMYHYLRELELAIRESGRPVVDCTEGGSLKQGTRVRRLAEFLADCPPGEMPPPGAGPSGLDRARLSAAARDLDRRIMEFLEVRSAIDQKLRTHRRVEKALADGEPVDRLLRTVVELGERIQRQRRILTVMQELASSGFYRAGVAQRDTDAAGGGEADKLRERFRRDDELIRELASAADFLEPPLRDARRRCAELSAAAGSPSGAGEERP
ncbi:MAG TPA: DUF115 domain-containing protein [Planctomycetota bacterium]|nr:DUF115 domain-containing protein [Planctomycetota bacterium]